MRKTVLSALFIALCLLFAATTYASALRPSDYENLKRLKYKLSADDKMWEKPNPWAPTRKYFMSESESESEIMPRRSEGRRVPRIVCGRSGPVSSSWVKSSLTLMGKPCYFYRPSVVKQEPAAVPQSDLIRYTTLPVRPKYELYADGPFSVVRPYLDHFVRMSDDDDFEEYDEEDWSVRGSVGNGGNWNAGASYSKGGFTGSASVGKGGNWNAGASYSKGGFTGGATVGKGGQWSANAGYNTQVGRGNLSVGGQVSKGGNYNVGATYSLRF